MAENDNQMTRTRVALDPKEKEKLADALMLVGTLEIASCECATKTNEASFHHPDCRYRKLTIAFNELKDIWDENERGDNGNGSKTSGT